MEIASRLWAAGIKAEFGFKPNPKMGDQLNHAFETAIPFMVLFGDDEINKGVVKLKVGKSNYCRLCKHKRGDNTSALSTFPMP